MCAQTITDKTNGFILCIITIMQKCTTIYCIIYSIHFQDFAWENI